MKAEISQVGLYRDLRLSGVFQQQGRMLVDRDWNELCGILRHLGTVAASESIGTGVPRHDGLVAVPVLGSSKLSLRNSGGLVAAQGLIGQPGPRPMRPTRRIPLLDPAPNTLETAKLMALRVAPEVAPQLSGVAFDPIPLGEVNLYRNQRDLPETLPDVVANASSPLLTAPPTGRLLYVDIWERMVNAFELETLIDPALHGADTCVRTQRMVQIKAATAGDVDATTEPCQPVLRLPQKGNALFDALLTPAGEGADECDPCADQVTITRSLANQLFRLEVHSVRFDAGRRPVQIVLKWSRDNGAREQTAAAFAPAGDRSYEFFSNATELLLGVPSDDWAVDEKLLRGILDPADAKTTGAMLPRVREWDGWCRLDLSGAWSISDGRYAGKPLGTAVAVSGNALSAKLDDIGITFTLQLGDKDILAGDYWLALVRNRAVTDKRVRVLSSTPLGVEHRYCVLGVAGQDGNVTTLTNLTPYDVRRLQHPSLTCIDAYDVGFKPDCTTSIYSQPAAKSVATVHDALELLCNVTADQILFKPDCDTSIYNTEQAAKVANVRDALELLCNVTADQILFKPDCNTSIFSQQQAAYVNNVHDALELLCNVTADQIVFKPDCSTSIFSHEDARKVANVRDALELLCKVTADQILFEPKCDYLRGAKVHDVGAALEALCARGASRQDLVRIKSVSWTNDWPMTYSTFLKGLSVEFSEAIFTRTMNTHVFIVTAEPSAGIFAGSTSEYDGFLTPQILTGVVEASGNRARFVPQQGQLLQTIQRIVSKPNTNQGFTGLRMRVRLIGRSIFDAQGVRGLDGFVPMKPLDAKIPGAEMFTVNLDFSNPGIGTTSDFESWFFLITDPRGPRDEIIVDGTLLTNVDKLDPVVEAPNVREVHVGAGVKTLLDDAGATSPPPPSPPPSQTVKEQTGVARNVKILQSDSLAKPPSDTPPVSPKVPKK